MKLNIYEKKKIVKTYETDAYDLPWGVVTDVTNAINLDNLKNGTEEELYQAVGTLLITSGGMVNEMMKDMFDGLTDEELRKASTPEIIECIIDVVIYTINRITKGFEGGKKNK